MNMSKTFAVVMLIIAGILAFLTIAVAQQNLRSVLSFCNSPQMTAPEAYIQFTPGLITDDGEVTKDTTADFLRTFMQNFHVFITRVRSALPKQS